MAIVQVCEQKTWNFAHFYFPNSNELIIPQTTYGLCDPGHKAEMRDEQ